MCHWLSPVFAGLHLMSIVLTVPLAVSPERWRWSPSHSHLRKLCRFSKIPCFCALLGHPEIYVPRLCLAMGMFRVPRPASFSVTLRNGRPFSELSEGIWGSVLLEAVCLHFFSGVWMLLQGSIRDWSTDSWIIGALNFIWRSYHSLLLCI